MPWSIASQRVNFFQTKLEIDSASAAALKAHRDIWEQKIAEKEKAEGRKGPRSNCGTLSGYGIPRPDCRIDIKIRATPRDMPNVMSFREGYLINESIRTIIEKHDPGIHGFWPVNLKWRNGKEIADQYWLLNLGRRLETICEESSSVVIKRNQSGHPFQKICVFEKTKYSDTGDKEADMLKKPLPIVLKKETIGDAALWTEAHFGYKAPVANIMSDALYEELKGAGLKIWAPECYFDVI